MDQGVVPSGLSGDDPVLDFLVIVALFAIAGVVRLFGAYKARQKKVEMPISTSMPSRCEQAADRDNETRVA